MKSSYSSHLNSIVLSWYLTVVASLSLCLMLLIHISFPTVQNTPIKLQYRLYKSLPTNASPGNEPTATITKEDARALLIKNFFQSYDAPLSSQAQTFVKVADKYHLDYRLLPAIAMQESSGGKRLPEESFNPFGYGIYGDNVKKFTSYEEAIDIVGQGLKKNYIDLGLTTPDKIMPKYTPPSVEKGGPWAIGVNLFMEELR